MLASPRIALAVLLILSFFGVAVAPVAGGGGPADAPLDHEHALDRAVAWQTANESAGQGNGTALVATNTTIVVQLQPDGDARWTITETFNLSTDGDREAFRETAADFEAGEAPGAAFGLDAFVLASERMTEETGRQMSIVGEERSASSDAELTDGWGELSLSFTWENFARTSGGNMYVDDVFGTEETVWLQGLTETQQLAVRAPEGFGFDDANVVPRGGELHWEGPVTFTNETLQATLVGQGPGPGDDTTTPSDGTGDGLMGTLGPLVGVVGVLAALLAIAVLAVSRGRLQPLMETDADDRTAEANEPDAESATAAGQVAEAGSQDDDDGGDGGMDPELLSDEERVERLLERNGGRMKQANIVKETDWSNAKVSQLLSSMEEDGRIDKLRIGRENLISFPDEDLTDFDND